jgi:hypothetical protein
MDSLSAFLIRIKKIHCGGVRKFRNGFFENYFVGFWNKLYFSETEIWQISEIISDFFDTSLFF